MIYELRIYRAMPGKLPSLIKRFTDATLRMFEKHGIQQAGFWTVIVGESNLDLYYMLKWDSLDERQRKFDAFATDPEWAKARADSIKDGEIVANISNTILNPTAFSAVK